MKYNPLKTPVTLGILGLLSLWIILMLDGTYGSWIHILPSLAVILFTFRLALK